MSVQQAYNSWAAQYDTNLNKTRDLEGLALRKLLQPLSFNSVLEIGCGTGKNTEWFITRAEKVTAVDLSDEMLAKARAKIRSDRAEFAQADITKPWRFATQQYQLATYSLVLEHIADLDPVMEKTAAVLEDGGYLYVGELHPFKQYTGSKARFETENGVQVVECYNHHVSDFLTAAKKHGLQLIELDEFFDDGDRSSIPRILALIFQKR